MRFQIKNRFSGEVQFECELSAEIADKSYSLQLGFAIKSAIYAGANLADADLAGADLAGADLAGADLADANLAGADLAGADLADANLADANLAGADLAGADLAGADLAGAYLAGANLARADLAGADLAGADLARAKNVPETNGSESIQEPTGRRERQIARARRFRERFPDVPVVDQLDAKILAAIEGGGALEMGSWHQCETTHCRGGWAVTLAGERGKALEKRYGVEDAARRIYLASTGRCPWFFASNEAALADIREQAELLKAAP